MVFSEAKSLRPQLLYCVKKMWDVLIYLSLENFVPDSSHPILRYYLRKKSESESLFLKAICSFLSLASLQYYYCLAQVRLQHALAFALDCSWPCGFVQCWFSRPKLLRTCFSHNKHFSYFLSLTYVTWLTIWLSQSAPKCYIVHFYTYGFFCCAVFIVKV